MAKNAKGKDTAVSKKSKAAYGNAETQKRKYERILQRRET